jgi:hypothetical protein
VNEAAWEFTLRSGFRRRPDFRLIVSEVSLGR